ncbi:MAG: ribosome maturation factor RimP [Gammaproteobacteria bacterium]|nr:ribosome maturation factor RimP [Gammaproteobacteria bacterium]
MASDALEPLISPTVSGLGYELLGIERQRLPQGLLLRLYIDGPEGITLHDCERVTKQVRDLFEVDNLVRGEYLLEVSSPGLDRPLFKQEHYRRFCGATVQLRLRLPVAGRRRLQGVLTQVDDTQVVLVFENENFTVPLSAIDRARVVPEWPDKQVPKGKAPRKKQTG